MNEKKLVATIDQSNKELYVITTGGNFVDVSRVTEKIIYEEQGYLVHVNISAFDYETEIDANLNNPAYTIDEAMKKAFELLQDLKSESDSKEFSVSVNDVTIYLENIK